MYANTYMHESGHDITTDNFFTDLTLAEDLKEKQSMIGTIRKK